MDRGALSPTHSRLAATINKFLKQVKQRPAGYSDSASRMGEKADKGMRALFQAKHTILLPNASGDYSTDKVLTHAVEQLVPSFSISTRVLREIKARSKPDEVVFPMLDYGAGAGAGIAAMTEVFGIPTNGNTITAIEPSPLMTKLGDGFMQDMLGEEALTSVRWHRSLAEVDGEFHNHYGLVLLSLVLGEVNMKKRKDLLVSLWRGVRPGGMLVLTDSADAAGIERIAQAREDMLEVFPPSLTEEDASSIMAPCGHDGICPARDKSLLSPTFKSFECKFAQRIQRTALPSRSLLSKLKRSKGSRFESEASVEFTYLVIRKGPSSRLQLKASPPTDESEMDFSSESHTYDRVIRSPLKKSKFVILDVCSSAEEGLSRRTITKGKYGALGYKDAKKSHWGDLYAYN